MIRKVNALVGRFQRNCFAGREAEDVKGGRHAQILEFLSGAHNINTALADPPPVPVTGSVGIDGSGVIQKANTPQVLFNGKTPPHGFQIYAQQELWYTDFGTPNNLNNLSSPSWIAIQPGGYYTQHL